MRILVTADYASTHCNWQEFCDMVGLEPWSLSEGMDPNREFELTLEQAKELELV